MALNYIRTACYNFWLGNSFELDALDGCSTPTLYRQMLDYISSDSSILEVGVGSGMPLLVNQNKIVLKRLRIHAIDIDEAYVESCKERLKDITNILIEKRDLFTITNQKYDYIIFSESYPVIPEELMTNMIHHCLTLLNPNGKIIFLHNLLEDETQKQHPIAIIKPYIKYIPFVWIDFGRATSKSQFETWINQFNLKTEYFKLYSSNVQSYFFDDYSIDQYLVIASPN